MTEVERERRLANLEAWANRCQSEGRIVQSLLVRNVILEVLMGAPHLEYMAEHDIEVTRDSR